MAETAAPPTPELLGLRLYGEGLDDAALAAWFADEEEGYASIAGDEGEDSGASQSNSVHAFRYLGPRQFARCLALGAASGREYAGLEGRIGSFVAIEPGRRFWRPTIAGAPTEYRAPTSRGTIDLPDGSCDLAGSFGVLHHIPNVSEVLRELARVLAPGGMLMIREPIISLGDFRRPRPGLTRNERGIPPLLMDRMLAEAGFVVKARRFLDFPGSDTFAQRLGVARPWDRAWFVRLDHAVSRLMAWNARYWRPRLIDKLAPRVACWVAERR
jgi:SAM-dependent methyltransferase